MWLHFCKEKQCSGLILFILNTFHLEFFLHSFSGHPKIETFPLPTHSRDSYRKFFYDPFLNEINFF